MSEKRMIKLNGASLENVSGGSYFSYTLSDGDILWCVYDQRTGNFDPGYRTEEEAIAADIRCNGRAEETSAGRLLLY